MTGGYWKNVCEIQKRQTEKGLKSYGGYLEEDTSLTPEERITMVEEELVDALMYLEHLKAGL